MKKNLKRLKIKTLFFFCSILIFQTSIVSASDLETIRKKLESKIYSWNHLKSELVIRFYKNKNLEASCIGNLKYKRAEENILLECFDYKARFLFGFRIEDLEFKLYLPKQNELIFGNIMDLEFAPRIESHLSPLDLYKALNPKTFDLEKSSILKKETPWAEVHVKGFYHDKSYTSRKLVIDENGNLTEEVYLDPGGIPSTYIRRFGFDGSETIHPKTIVIHSMKKSNTTEITFKNPHETSLEKNYSDWLIPEKTEKIKIDYYEKLSKASRPTGWSRKN